MNNEGHYSGYDGETYARKEFIFDNPLLPSPATTPAVIPSSSDHHQVNWNAQHQSVYRPAQSDSQRYYGDAQHTVYAQEQSYAQQHTSYVQPQYSNDQQYSNTFNGGYYQQPDQQVSYPAEYPYNQGGSYQQAPEPTATHYAYPPVVPKISSFSCLSSALIEPVLQHPRPALAYTESTYSSLMANVVSMDYSKRDYPTVEQVSAWHQQHQQQQQEAVRQEAQYHQHAGHHMHAADSVTSYAQEISVSKVSANELPPPSYPQANYSAQETVAHAADTTYHQHVYQHAEQPQAIADNAVYMNHQQDRAPVQSYATASSGHQFSQVSYAPASNGSYSSLANYAYQEPAGASQSAYTIPQPMLQTTQTGTRRQFAVPPPIVPTQSQRSTTPADEPCSPGGESSSSSLMSPLEGTSLLRRSSITPLVASVTVKSEEQLSRPSLIVKSSLVRAASHLHVDVGQASLDSPTSHRARQERRKAQARNSSAPYPPISVDMGQGHKVPGASAASSPTSSSQPLVISLTERKPVAMPEYVPAATASSTSASSGPTSGQHQIIAFSGSPEPLSYPPKIIEGDSESSPSGGKPTTNITRVIQLDENGEKKPFLACGFCRHRKIACGQGPVWENDDQLPPGPRTCNQCFRRCLECFYPTESRRGLRKGKPSRKIVYDDGGESVSFVAGEEEEGPVAGSSTDVPDVADDSTLIVEEEDGTGKGKGKGKNKPKGKNWKDFTGDMVRAVDADWVLARR